jgi:hypothetical protein
VALYGRRTRHRRSSCAASEIIGDRHAMPRAHLEPAACARGKWRVLLETSAHSLPTAWTLPGLPLFPWVFFRGLQLCTTFGIRACGSAVRPGPRRTRDTGASPPPPGPRASGPLPSGFAVRGRGRRGSVGGARRGVGFRPGGRLFRRRDRLFEGVSGPVRYILAGFVAKSGNARRVCKVT